MTLSFNDLRRDSDGKLLSQHPTEEARRKRKNGADDEVEQSKKVKRAVNSLRSKAATADSSEEKASPPKGSRGKGRDKGGSRGGRGARGGRGSRGGDGGRGGGKARGGKKAKAAEESEAEEEKEGWSDMD